jgi:hexosaminidase
VNSLVYQSPILLEESAVLTAVSIKEGMKSIESVTDYTRIKGVKDIFLKDEPNSRYPSQGVLSLVDGQRGSSNHRDGAWMGFEEDGLEMTIDFGEKRTIRKVTVGCLENEESWIFLPVSVELFISETGEYFRSAEKLIRKDRDEMAGKGINNFTREIMGLQTRYLRIKVRNIGICPEGHPGAGGKAWLFVDEIIIE